MLIFILGLILLNSNLVFVIAQGNGSSDVFQSIGNFISGFAKFMNPVLKYILGDVSDSVTYSRYNLDSGQILFAKLLFFLLILAIVYMIVRQLEDFFQNNEFIMWTVAIIVSILSVRFLSASVIKAIIFPYEVSGIALAAFLPFLLWFVFMEWGLRGSRNRIVRKVGWIFYLVIMIGIYITRMASGGLGPGSWIYPITFILSIIAFLMDGTIQRSFHRSSMKNIKSRGARNHLDQLYHQYDIVLNNKTMGFHEREQRLKELEREIDYWERKAHV